MIIKKIINESPLWVNLCENGSSWENIKYRYENKMVPIHCPILHVALLHKRSAFEIGLLIKQGANPDMPVEGYTPLMAAIELKHDATPLLFSHSNLMQKINGEKVINQLLVLAEKSEDEEFISSVACRVYAEAVLGWLELAEWDKLENFFNNTVYEPREIDLIYTKEGVPVLIQAIYARAPLYIFERLAALVNQGRQDVNGLTAQQVAWQLGRMDYYNVLQGVKDLDSSCEVQEDNHQVPIDPNEVMSGHLWLAMDA
jgi:hypothetical protein